MKKISLWLVVLSMLMTLLPGAMVSAADEWFDIEVEDGAAAASHNVANESASGGRYVVANDSKQGNFGESQFTLEADGTYDVWAVIGVDDSNYIGGYTFTLDGDDVFYSKSTELANQDAVGDALYTSIALTSGAHSKAMKWVKLAEDKTIAAGDHTLRSEVSKATTTNNKMGTMDVVRFVPSDWEWTPSNNFDAPTAPSAGGGEEDDGGEDVSTGDNDPTEDGYVHAEAENASYTDGKYTVREDTNASNGKALIPVDGATPAETALAFNVTIPEAKKYDVYALVALKDYSSSAWRLLVDGTTYDQQLNIGAGKIYDININLGYARKMQWVKFASGVELAAGDTSIVANIPTLTHTSSGSWLTAIDAIRVVPTDWYWAPDASLSEPEPNLNVPNEDGALLMEAEKGSMSGTMTATDLDKASGGAYAAVKSTGTVGSTTMGFATEEDETYDVWAAIATNAVNWLGGYVFTLDDQEIYNSCLSGVPTSNPDLYGETVVLHTGNSSGSASTVRWVKVGHRQSVSGGSHTITASTRAGTGAPNTTGLIDCIALIPSSWSWTGSDKLELPENPENLPEEGEEGLITTEWFDIEVENGTSEDTIKTGTTAGRTYMFTSQGGVAGAKTTTSTFTTQEAKTYDIWAVVGTHSAGGNLCSYTFTLDGTAFNSISAGNYDAANALYTGPTVAAGHTVTMVWAKVASNVELPAGDHSLFAEITKAPLNSNKFGAIDVVSFIPSEWGLSETTPLGLQLAKAVKNEYFSGDYTAVTENLVLPEEIPTIAGITIGYESDNASVIANDGTVTRPYFNTEDANVNFNVVASFADSTQKATVPMTVLKNTKYTVADFVSTESLTEGSTFTASADVNVNAAADSGITGQAALIVALYNADGSLAAIAMDADIVTSEATTFEAGLTVPAGVSSAKVYIVNGLGMANQLAETITVQ